MIAFKSNGSKLTCEVETGSSAERSVLVFEFETGACPAIANIVARELAERLAYAIEQRGKQEYGRGYKDGRAKRAKAVWFQSWFESLPKRRLTREGR